MHTKWISPKTIIGSVATGDYFFPRQDVVEEIWEELDKGNFVILAAPRRVGKSSILKDLEKKPKDGYKVKFENIQSLTSENEFYQKIYKIFLSCLDKSAVTEVTKWLKKYMSNKDIKLTTSGIELKNNTSTFNYKNEIELLLNDLEGFDECVVILLDELPEVLHNLYKKEKKEEAISILKQLRNWRQKGYQKLRFVITGSIGIHYVVQAIEGRNADLNDLKKVNCPALDTQIATDYIEWATKDATIKYSKELQDYFKEKIKSYFTPFFINILLEQVDKNAKKKKKTEITIQDIDQAFTEVVKQNDHFLDWKKRLSDYMPADDFAFVNEILIHISHNDSITVQKIYDKSSKHNKKDSYMELINDLENDGYILEHNNVYTFISPYLKAFWSRNNPIYNED